MKKAIFLTVLVFLSVSSFADSRSNKYLFIDGMADGKGHYEFFLVNFTREAKSSGYIVTDKENEAAHTLHFSVTPNIGRQRQSTPNDNQYAVKISLVNNSSKLEIITFDFFFTELNEVYNYTRQMFQEVAVYIPILTEGGSFSDDVWKNKWIYFRASFDYPVTFYTLKPNGLIGGIGLYDGPFDSPTAISPIDHKNMAMPGFTIGFEFQLLKFFSIELNYQLSMGDTRSNYFVNMGLGAELKFPIKFQNIVLVPYGAFTYPLTISKIFSEFPPFAVGLGFQFCVRGGKHGAFFIDINYMFSFTDAVMRNPYLDFPLAEQLYPNPAVIHYGRSVIGIGIGYKIGILDR